ncbi:MAG: type III-A CRISPR-associated protein Csm2 [Cyanobacteria bacterium NC_groundwater_1444_Ag_S-0.65um_54_12]|nr:type III-A CRISPR-associated protein Csm2 [Cyanobacteria bacterium NC_groundwater_1444_Ag_S-0.65um_54_12]
MAVDYQRAEELGKRLSDDSVTSNQIRKLLSGINRLTNRIAAEPCAEPCGELSPALQGELQLVRARLAYQVGKAEDKDKEGLKEGLRELYRALDPYFKKIGKETKKFQELANYVEAIVAYHKYHEKN